MHWPLR